MDKPDLKNRVDISYDGHLLTVRLKGRLHIAYYKQDIGETYIQEYLHKLFTHFEKFILTNDDFYLMRIEMMAEPSIGKCTVCGKQANLLGGLCYFCKESNIEPPVTHKK